MAVFHFALTIYLLVISVESARESLSKLSFQICDTSLSESFAFVKAVASVAANTTEAVPKIMLILKIAEKSFLSENSFA